MATSTVFLLITCSVLFGSPEIVEASFKERDKVLYKDLGSLYFSQGEMTRARRTYSVPQLQCLKGCNYPQPKTVQCTNTGWDGSSNLWKCKSDLDSSYALDKVEIVCEGYSSPDDAYVTVGSCSLEYSIKKRGSSDDSVGGVSGLIFLIFCCVLIYILYVTCLRPNEEPINQNSFTNGDGPDDGQGPNRPNMGWNIPGMNQRHTPGNSRGFGFTPRPNACGNQDNLGGGGGGGFWTGIATGGVLGYLMGGNRNARYNYRAQPSSYFGGGYTDYNDRQSSGSGGSSGLFSSSSESVATARYRQR